MSLKAFESEPEDASLLQDQRWQLVERVVTSPRFSKSTRLCNFLRFVSKETLQGRGEWLNEHLIGVRVFERKTDYDSADDNIVRSHASRLRERLEAYFLAEGSDEPFRIALPRGAYVPIFEPMQAFQSPLPTPVDKSLLDLPSQNEVVTTKASVSYWKIVAMVFFLAMVSLAAAFIYQWHRTQILVKHEQSSTPVLRSFWDEILPPNRRTLIVPADATLGTYRLLTGGKHVPLDAYLSKSYLASDPNKQEGSSSEIAQWILQSRFTSMADVDLTAQLLRVPEASVNMPQIRFARDLQMADLRESNVIFIGGQLVNPWLALFQERRNFIITEGTPTEVINRAPLPGEPHVYPYDPHDPQHVVYAVIAMLPNLSGEGVVLMVEGTTIGGTEGAADLLTDPSQLEPILAPAYRRYGHIPPFEMLLKTTDLSGSAPQTKMVAVRFHAE